MRIQRDVTKYQADLAAKVKARDENQSKIDARVEAKDKAREVKQTETEKEDEYDGLFGENEEEEEEQDGDGEVSHVATWCQTGTLIIYISSLIAC
jgi:hypothetical protein